MMRIGELTLGPHAAKACNIHSGMNKNKIMVILYTSKTHGIHMNPQKIKITALGDRLERPMGLICPFKAIRDYLSIRGAYDNDDENFFIFNGKEAVKASNVREVLKSCLKALNLDPVLYNTQSWRIGRASDLLLKHHWTVDRIKSAGRWKSNAVFRYLHQ